MPIRTVKTTPEQKKELVQLCREYADLQKKAVDIRWALNDQVAALAGVTGSGEVAGLSTDFTQIEVVSAEEWKEVLLNGTTSERWVCTGFAPTEADLRARKASIERSPQFRPLFQPSTGAPLHSLNITATRVTLLVTDKH